MHPRRVIHVADEDWQAARIYAMRHNVTASELVRQALASIGATPARTDQGSTGPVVKLTAQTPETSRPEISPQLAAGFTWAAKLRGNYAEAGKPLPRGIAQLLDSPECTSWEAQQGKSEESSEIT